MKKIITLASLNMDVVLPVKELPKTGETIFGGHVSYVPGGKGLNQVVAASRVGARVHAIGKVGSDQFGKKITAFLKKEKISKLSVSTAPHPTGAALIFVAPDGNCTIGVGSGVNMTLSSKIVEKFAIEKGDVALATLEVPQKATLTLFQRAKKAGAHTVLNSAPATVIKERLIKITDFLILNEMELLTYLKRKFNPKNSKEAITATESFLKRHPHLHIILTLGENGVVYVQKGASLFIPAHKVKVVDTTGAGDCFTGVFSAELSKGKTISETLAFANGAAALAVTKFGASSMPKKDRSNKVFG